MKLGVPRIALIHATALAVEPIQAAFALYWPQVMRMNLLDDSLSVDLAAAGRLKPDMVQRFVDLAQYAKRTGCNGILFTCSAFGSAIETVAAQIGLPTLKPNEAMFEEALNRSPVTGARLGLIATFEASIPSMSLEMLDLAKARGRQIELQTCFVPEAMQDLAHGDTELHHAKIAQAALRLKDCHVIMLAQFSMAAAQPAVQAGLSSPVLSSPDCAVLSLMKTMNYEY